MALLPISLKWYNRQGDANGRKDRELCRNGGRVIGAKGTVVCCERASLIADIQYRIARSDVSPGIPWNPYVDTACRFKLLDTVY